MKYCKECILPDSRPNLKIEADGVCNACHSWQQKKYSIDWENRASDFQQLVQNVKANAQKWDCVIPVSGGKDSTWQVIKALEYGLKPLCVTWKTPARNKIGQENLNNLISQGVDHIDFSINPNVEKKFTLKTFERAGTLAIPMHMALFAIPLQVASSFNIPLIIWGENAGMEYGNSSTKHLGFEMDRDWIMTYGVTNGTTPEDWIDDELTYKDMSPYLWPDEAILQKQGVKAIFLGWYFKWDPHETYRVAQAHGFKGLTSKPKTGLYDFADIDDDFLITIHHWMKWYKFGFTRLWDNLAIEIRMGKLSRNEAIDIIQNVGEEYPLEAINKFCAWADITRKEFDLMANKFRNEAIWRRTDNGWEIKNSLLSTQVEREVS